jgi:hypothetical protein
MAGVEGVGAHATHRRLQPQQQAGQRLSPKAKRVRGDRGARRVERRLHGGGVGCCRRGCCLALALQLVRLQGCGAAAVCPAIHAGARGVVRSGATGDKRHRCCRLHLRQGHHRRQAEAAALAAAAGVARLIDGTAAVSAAAWWGEGGRGRARVRCQPATHSQA